MQCDSRAHAVFANCRNYKMMTPRGFVSVVSTIDRLHEFASVVAFENLLDLFARV
jgi:hypothetical protein